MIIYSVRLAEDISVTLALNGVSLNKIYFVVSNSYLFNKEIHEDML